MKAQERNYLRERLNAIMSKKETEIRDKCSEVSIDKLYEALKNGKFKLKKPKAKTYWNCSDFFEIDKGKYTVDPKPFLDAIRLERSKVMDEIMLGDQEDILEKLREFESKEVNINE